MRNVKNLIGYHIEKANNLLLASQVQFPRGRSIISFDNNLPYIKNIVNIENLRKMSDEEIKALSIDIKHDSSYSGVDIHKPKRIEEIKEETTVDKLDRIIGKYEEFLDLFKSETKNYKDWKEKSGKQLKETLLQLKERLNMDPNLVASLLPKFFEESNPNSLEDHGLWNYMWHYLEEHSLAGTYSKSINKIINKPETKALALSIMQDIIDYTDGRLFYCSYISNGVVINEDIMNQYLHQYGTYVQAIQDSSSSAFIENPDTVHYSYQALQDYLKDRDTLRFYINTKSGRTQFLTNDRVTSYLAALDEYIKLGDTEKSLEFSDNGRDFIEVAKLSLDGETILKSLKKSDIEQLDVLYEHIKKIPVTENMVRNMDDYFTYLLAYTNTQMRQEQKADKWKVRLAAPNNAGTYIEVSVERDYRESEPSEATHDRMLVKMYSFVDGSELDTGKIDLPVEKFLSDDPKYNIMEGEIFRSENEKYIMRQMCKRLALAMNENEEPVLYMSENLGEALEAFDAKVLQEPRSEIEKNMSLEQIEEKYGSVDEYTRLMFEEGNVETYEEDDLESVEVSLEEYEQLRASNPGSPQKVAIESTVDYADPEIGFVSVATDNMPAGTKYRLVTFGEKGDLVPYQEPDVMYLNREELQDYIEAHKDALEVVDYDDMIYQAGRLKSEYTSQQHEMIEKGLHSFEFEDGYLHFSIDINGYTYNGLYRVYDPVNGKSREIVNIEYGDKDPAIAENLEYIKHKLIQYVNEHPEVGLNGEQIPRERPSIYCEWSEHGAFRKGAVYTPSEFSRIMEESDNEWIKHREMELQQYGKDAFDILMDQGLPQHQTYAKVKYEIYIPGMEPLTVRQDIGDGFGSVYSFLKRNGYMEYANNLIKNMSDVQIQERLIYIHTNYASMIGDIQKFARFEIDDLHGEQDYRIVNKDLSDYEKFAQMHKESMDAKEVNRIPIVINAFGGPGSGKSVSCMDICQQLKKLGYNAEYVQEYAKELVYAEDWEQLDGSPNHQFEVLQEQLARVDRLYGKVDFIVTDSPILLNGVYNKELTPEYDQMVTSLYNDFENFTYFVERDASSYQQEGRIQNLEESQKIDQEIKDLLTEKNIYFGTYNHETIDKVVNNSIATYNRINHIEEPATKKQIAYAKKIAETLQIDMPEQNTRAAYNEFISANQEKFKNTSTPISQNETSYDLEHYMNLVSENGSRLSEVPQEFYTPELLLAAVNNWGAAVRMIPETLMTEELALAAVKQYGMNLRSIPNEYKNEDICIEAYVSSNGKAIRYVPAELKENVKEQGNKILLSSNDIPDVKRQIDVSDIQESGKEWVSKIDNILKEHEENPDAMIEDIAFAAKFYNYSVKNIQLMLQQNRGITYVASAKAFNTMGYRVKEGEEPLVARVPVFSKYVLSENGEKIYMNQYTEQIRQEIKKGSLKEMQFVRKFQFVAAFYDISQTDCPVEDYPSLYNMGIPSEFHQEAFEAMKQFAEDTLGFKVLVEDLKSISLYGSCDVKNKVIRINNRLESTQALSTLCHEIAHGILHTVDDRSKMTTAQKECEADVMSIMLETSLGLSISPSRRDHLYNHFHEYKDEQANKERPYEVTLEKLIDRVQSKVFKVYIDDINYYLDSHMPKNIDKSFNQKLIRDMANLDVAYGTNTSEFVRPDIITSAQNQMDDYMESYRKISDEIRLSNSFVPKLGVIRKETVASQETYELMDVLLLDDKIAKLLIRYPEQIRREYLSLDMPKGSILALKQNVMEKPIYYRVAEDELIPLEAGYAEQISNGLPESKINVGLTMQKEFDILQELHQAEVKLTEEQQQRFKHLNRYFGEQKSNHSSQEFMARLNLMTEDLSASNRELIHEYVFRTGNFERAYKYCERLETEPGVLKEMLDELHAVDSLKYMLWTISEYEDATGVSPDKRLTTGAYNSASLPVLTENVLSIQNITDAYKLIQKYQVMERFKNYAVVKQNDEFLLADVILDDYNPEIRLSDMKFDSELDAKLYFENELSGDKRNLLMGVEDLEMLLQKDSMDNAVYLDTFVTNEQIDLYRELSQTIEPMVDDRDNVIYDDLVEANKKDDINFANSIDMYLNNTLDKTSPIIVGKTSNALALAGAELNKIVTINYSTIKKCMSSKETVYHGHELDSDIVKQIPEQLRNPVMILKGSHDASLIVVSNLVDKNNDQIIISIDLDKKMAFCEVNQITSMYGKERFTNYVSKQLNQGNLIACNNKKADEMLHSIGLQLPQENTFISYDDSIIYNLSYVNDSLFKNRGIDDEAAASLEQSVPSQEAFKSISESHVCQDKYAYVDFGNPEKTYLYTTDLIGNIWRNPITDESAYELYSRLKEADYQVCMSFADFKALAHNQSIDRFHDPMQQKDVYIRIIESNQDQLPKDTYLSVYDFKKKMDVLQLDTNAEKMDITYKVITRQNREICSYINKVDKFNAEDVYVSIYNKVKEQNPDLCKQIAKQYYEDQIQFNENHLLRPLMEFMNAQENDEQLVDSVELLMDSNDALKEEIRKLDIAPADAEVLKLQAGKIDSSKLADIENQIQMNSQIKQKNQQTKKDISIAD